MGKHLNIDRYLQAVRWATDRGVFGHGFSMLGFPTETEAEMNMTIQVMFESRLHTATFFTVIPFPNTELHDYVMTHTPEKLANIRFDDAEYTGIKINLSAEPDEVLFACQRKAWHKFYLNPVRAFRIVRDHPHAWFLPYFIPMYLLRSTKGLFKKS